METRNGGHPLNASLVKVQTRSRDAAGAGCYVGMRYVATCAHVVYAALDRHWRDDGRNNQPRQHELVRLAFPFLGSDTRLAQVAAWDAMADFALLRLREPPPPGALAARLIPGDVVGEPYAVCGFPSPPPGASGHTLGLPNGVWSEGTLAYALPNHWLQMQGSRMQGIGVTQGFSGAPVWLPHRQGVGGMVSRCSENAQHMLAFCTPVRDLVQRALAEREPAQPAQWHTPTAKWHGYQWKLSTWLAQPEAPFGLLLAPAKWGKSTLLAQWGARVAAAEQARVLHVAVRPDDGTTSRLGLLRALADALACRPSDESPDEEAAALLREIHQALAYRPHYPVLLIVDGLSEVADWPWETGGLPFFPPKPDPMVKILVAVRTLGDDAEGRIWQRRLRWPDAQVFKLGRLTPADWADMLDCDPALTGLAARRPDLVRSLYENSFEGRPILLHRYLQALRELGETVFYESTDTLLQAVAERFDAEAPPRVWSPPPPAQPQQAVLRRMMPPDSVPASTPPPWWRRRWFWLAALLLALAGLIVS